MVFRHYHDLKTRIYSRGRQIKKNNKEKSETEWELIDEKKKLRKEVKRVAMEREVVFRLLKDKCDNLKLKKKAIQD